jgi:hypothetical protein
MAMDVASYRLATRFDRWCIGLVVALLLTKPVIGAFANDSVQQLYFAAECAISLLLCCWRIVEARRPGIVTPFVVFYGIRLKRANDPTLYLFYYGAYWAAVIVFALLAALSWWSPGSVQWQ